ncbi:MAG TPA: sigma-70 family RNA polymerase sigma factor [Niastella sp.]
MEEIQKIIQNCIQHDRLSQEKLYRHFYPSMFCLCKKFFQDDHAALEVVNDGMMKVFRALPGYKADQGAIFNWIYTIVRNTALDKLKLITKATEEMEEEYDGADETGSIVQQLEWKDIYYFLDRLPPATRPVFSLFYLEHYMISDIASRLQISTGTVKWHLSESRRILQPVLKKYFTL